MTKIFKPTVDIRRELQSIIEKYEAAAYVDKCVVESISMNVAEFFKERLDLISISYTDGTLTDEQFTIDFARPEVSIEITFYDFLQYYTAEVKTKPQEELLQSLVSMGMLNTAAVAELLIQKEFKASEMISPPLAEGYKRAKERMQIIQQRQQASLKWFLLPALLQKEDILRFLKSLSSEQLNTVAEEMCVDIDGISTDEVEELIISSLVL